MGSYRYFIGGAIGTLKPVARHMRPYAGSRGGAVYCLICDSTFTGCTFDGTRADDVGGAISVETGALRVEFCDFVKTTAGANNYVVLLSHPEELVGRSSQRTQKAHEVSCGSKAVSRKALLDRLLMITWMTGTEAGGVTLDTTQVLAAAQYSQSPPSR
jgi:hypothetical protein